MRKKESNEDIEFYTIFSEGEGAVTGEAVDYEQPPHELFFLLSFRAWRRIIWSNRVEFAF
jgi:hypothetical protein